MRDTNAAFDTLHALDYKSPVYLIHFDGETTDYCNLAVGSPTYTLKKYLTSIKGGKQTITPEEGSASISAVTFSLLDANDEIMALLATDPYFFHRKLVTISGGYAGMNESDLLPIRAGWVTGLKLNAKATAWEFTITDPLKWAQRKVFRNATEAATVSVGGNPISLMLKLLTSTGNGTNGSYDTLAEENGLGLDQSYIDIAGIEEVRDTWFQDIYMNFTIDEPIQCKKFIESEILKVLNAYPVIDGQGRISIRPFKPPLAAAETVQTFDEDVIVGLPKYDTNLQALINEVEALYDWGDPTADEFGQRSRYIDATSVNNRGPGNKELKIESKGITSAQNGANIMQQRANRVFQRFATPPLKLQMQCSFDQWLSEAGDIVPVTHALLPDLASGVRGLDEARMEIISIEVDWLRGRVKVTVLDTGFARNVYGVISPIMTVVTGTSTAIFSVSSADAARFKVGWVIDLLNANCVAKDTDHTITDITGTAITVSPAMSATPIAGDIAQFSTYDNVTAEQKKFGYICDSGDKLGTANDDAHLIVA